MSDFITGFISGVPLFVLPLFALLMFLGLKARQKRAAPVALFYGLPLLVIMALRSVLALPVGDWVWGLFAVLYVIGAFGGYVAQGRWILGYVGNKVQLGGENLTLLVMMVLFWANFVSGAFSALAPCAFGSPLFHVVFVICVATSSGSFLGRAARVIRRR